MTHITRGMTHIINAGQNKSVTLADIQNFGFTFLKSVSEISRADKLQIQLIAQVLVCAYESCLRYSCVYMSHVSYPAHISGTRMWIWVMSLMQLIAQVPVSMCIWVMSQVLVRACQSCLSSSSTHTQSASTNSEEKAGLHLNDSRLLEACALKSEKSSGECFRKLLQLAVLGRCDMSHVSDVRESCLLWYESCRRASVSASSSSWRCWAGNSCFLHKSNETWLISQMTWLISQETWLTAILASCTKVSVLAC
jgi:hypothetical protein